MERFLLQVTWCMTKSSPLLRSSSLLPRNTESLLSRARLICPLCQRQDGFFHTSVSAEAANRANKTKKNLVKAKVFSRSQSQKMLKKENIPMVVITPMMTVGEVTEILKTEIDAALKIHGHPLLATLPEAVIDDFDLIKKVVQFYGFRWKLGAGKAKEQEDLDVYPRPPPSPSDLRKRPPVVTIMGHVDHGKTTLLDSLRNSNVVDKEFGGITQHIGAFSVPLPSGEVVTFLDTPGHAAFTAMRARGANATDIIILVVAADDGIMAQTVESIEHARNACVPLIVAINKCDKPNVNIDYVVQGLSEHGVYLEEHGGDVQSVEISAKKGTNVHLLLEAIIAQAEMLEIKADPSGMVEGVVIEAHQSPGKGKVATVLVQRGTLEKGATLVAGVSQAKVRNIFNEHGKSLKQGTPGNPVEVTGWKDLPSAGELVLQVLNERVADQVKKWRSSQIGRDRQEQEALVIQQKRETHHAAYRSWRLNRLQTRSKVKFHVEEEVREGPSLAVVIKADVDGSLEAILDVISTYDSDQCRLDVVSSGVGDISEGDVENAAAFDGVVFAFNVKAPAPVVHMAKQKATSICHHNIIYKMVDDLKEQLTVRLPPSVVEEVLGEANVMQMFEISEGKKKVAVAGCRCTKGLLHRKKTFKLIRDGEIINEGSVDSLKHFRNEVETIKVDVECGMKFEDPSVVPLPGDTITCFELKETPQVLHWSLEF